jgi:uncharacterized protein YggE
MKNIFFILLIISAFEIQAQVKGNANNEINYVHDKNVNYYNANINIGNKISTNLPNPQWIDDRTVVLEVNALYNQKASSYTVILNMKQFGKTAEETDRLFNDRYAAFVSAISNEGIKKEDIYLDMISFVPVYEFVEEKRFFSRSTYNEIPKGFEIQQNIHISYKDSKVLSKIISAAARNEMYDIVKVDYFVDKNEDIYFELRKRAIDYINKEIVQFESLGIELDAAYRLIAEEEKSSFPTDRYSSYSSFSSQSLDGTTKGKVKTSEKSVSSYYDKIPYDKFEIVINPNILEPVVQYMYNLKVKFRLKAQEPSIKIEREKEFVWLSPSGELKVIEIQKEDAEKPKSSTKTTTVIPEEE